MTLHKAIISAGSRKSTGAIFRNPQNDFLSVLKQDLHQHLSLAFGGLLEYELVCSNPQMTPVESILLLLHIILLTFDSTIALEQQLMSPMYQKGFK